MYNNGTLATTGGGMLIAGVNSMWWLLGGFALIAAGAAFMRIWPRRTDVQLEETK